MAPKTVAIIMDGNGRWAKKKRLTKNGRTQKGCGYNSYCSFKLAQDMGIQN